MMAATLFPPTPPEAIELPSPERVIIWMRANEGVRMPRLEVPRPKDPERRERCRTDLVLFASTYFPDQYYNPQPYHLEVLERLQEQLLCRDRLVFKHCDAAPRGLGKTTLRRIATVWASLFLHEPAIAWLGYKDENAQPHIKTCRRWLYENPLLHDDFPEICNWVRHVKNDPKRASPVEWSDALAQLPNGALWVARGIKSGLVGWNLAARPGCVMMDDIETRGTVTSDTETKNIGDIIDQQLLRLGDPHRRSMYEIMGTVRTETCNVARYTDPEQSPGWDGGRRRALITEPDRSDLWEQYVELCCRRLQPPAEVLGYTDEDAVLDLDMSLEGFRLIKNEGLQHALKFYVIHREDMDRGAELIDPVHLPLWECYRELAESPKTFSTELQNIPWRDEEGLEVKERNTAFIRSHCSDYAPRTLPADSPADVYTLGADVHSHGIYYVVRGWVQADGTSWQVESGVSEVYSWKGMHPDERAKALLSGLRRLWDDCEQGWPVGDRHEALRIGFFDSGWEPGVVREFCRSHPGRAFPVQGQGGLHRKRREKSKKVRGEWMLGVDHWKHDLVRLMERPREAAGYWHLPREATLAYCKHMACERWVPKGRALGTDATDYHWDAQHRNNHWWDCEVYNTAAAHAVGVRWELERRATRPAAAAGYPAAAPGGQQSGGWSIGR